jgi:3-phosphoshikimate 1-carboxyvinyltransferase
MTAGEPVADIRVRYKPLRGVDVKPEWVPLAIDEFPVLFIAAACASGPTRLTGAAELRVKESDRIAAMAEGLLALGVTAEPTADGMVVPGKDSQTPPDAPVFSTGQVDAVGDHRIAMAFAVASLRANGPVHILDTANVATSFPGFASACSQIGLTVTEADADE